jgi:hypothetical protein
MEKWTLAQPDRNSARIRSLGVLGGPAPDDAPLVMRDGSTQEIYSLVATLNRYGVTLNSVP